jgi:hypothetical protein
MRKLRFTIGGLMWVVLMLAIGLAAWKNANAAWAGAIFLLTCGSLGLAIIGSVCHRDAARAGSLGFALFGCGYMGLVLASRYDEDIPMLPTLSLLTAIDPRFGTAPRSHGAPFSCFVVVDPTYFQLGHCFWTLLAAVLGGTLARAFVGRQAGRSEGPRSEAWPPVRPPHTGWLGTAIVSLTGLVLFTSAATIRSRSDPHLWTGATFAATCGLLGLLSLGAIFGRGRRREFCLGAVLFGTGYMLLVFGRIPGQPPVPSPTLATERFLDAARSWFPPVPRSVNAANARIQEALEQPIAMRFPYETTLDDLLKYIKEATSSPGYPGIPIYVNPIGLQEAERSLNSTVTVDLEGVPLKTTLRLCLKQLGLDCSVQDGYLKITSEDERPAALEDPLMVVGHCLLALFAAGLGGVLAPLVSAANRDRPGRAGVEVAPAQARAMPEDQAGRPAET